jgi:hypothetical protein
MVRHSTSLILFTLQRTVLRYSKMIPLHPIPEANFTCVNCHAPLKCQGWYMPGMRNLADLLCPQCGARFYADLPAGQALYTPMLLERESGTVHDFYGVEWFADWLRESFAQRTDETLPFVVQERLPITRPVVLLNCLDTLYGHSLLKLLNAQYYLDQRADLDVIVLVQPFLEWMIPDGVAEVWSVALPLRRGTEWNDWLALEIKRRIESYPIAYLSMAFSHPHPDDYEIERFTRIVPFPPHEWETRMERPTVTFIWREDRLWEETNDAASSHLDKIKRRLNRNANSLAGQRGRVSELAKALQGELPNVDFAVAGLGEPVDLEDGILDLRRPTVDAEVERLWCERYAASHLVVGVHGSNMLLPSAHAGGVVELIGEERWGNFLQDILFRPADYREMFFRYRFVPHSTTPSMLARLLTMILQKHAGLLTLMGPGFCQHGADYRTLSAPRKHAGEKVKQGELKQ